MKPSLYPEHITDPKRLEIGKIYVQKRQRKLFPNSNADELKKLDTQIEDWVDTKDEVAIRDYWDKVYAYKFETARKYWVNWLTAENVEWELEDVATENLRIIWPRLGVPDMQTLLGDPPYSAEQIRSKIENDDATKTSLLANSDQHALDTAPRDHYPLVGIQRDGLIYLEDGNRRGLRAILHDRPTIQAWVARTEGDAPKNYWISTGWFWQLVLLAERDDQELGLYKDVLQRVFNQSDVAKITYTTGVANGFFGERNPLAKELLK